VIVLTITWPILFRPQFLRLWRKPMKASISLGRRRIDQQKEASPI